MTWAQNQSLCVVPSTRPVKAQGGFSEIGSHGSRCGTRALVGNIQTKPRLPCQHYLHVASPSFLPGCLIAIHADLRGIPWGQCQGHLSILNSSASPPNPSKPGGCCAETLPCVTCNVMQCSESLGAQTPFAHKACAYVSLTKSLCKK